MSEVAKRSGPVGWTLVLTSAWVMLVSHTLGVQRGKLRPGKARGVACPSTRLC